MRWMGVLSLSCLLFAGAIARCESDDLDTQLMLNTFKISNAKSNATVWALALPAPDACVILVSAAHVFTKMEGDEATLNLRKKDSKDEDLWIQAPVKIKIRNEDKALWTKHPDADVAVMRYATPLGLCLTGVPLELLATDEILKQYEIHPGDTLKCTGYPHPVQFNSGSAWFPIVRQGCIAGFPLTPMSKYKTFIADINVFEGNSGGAFYCTDSNRFYNGKTQGGRVQFIIGLLSEQHFLNDKYETAYESGTFKHRLGLGVVVNAKMIRETIDLLKKSEPQVPLSSVSTDAKEVHSAKKQ